MTPAEEREAEFWVVETTVGTAAGAKRLARGALERRLCACANVHPAGPSHYWWKGRIEESRESLISFKTTNARLEDLVQWLGAEHPYEVPYIGVFPLDLLSNGYAEWVRREARPVSPASPGPRKRPATR